jgi:hypothetical protein
MTVLFNQQINRTTPLPDKVLADINYEISTGEFSIEGMINDQIKTYGDVAFLSQVPDHPMYKAVMKALAHNKITPEKLGELK